MHLSARIALYLLSLGVAAYALIVYLAKPVGALVVPAMRLNFEAHEIGIYTHIFAALFALAIGPFQFSERLRNSRPKLHRRLGQLYLGIGVLIGGLAGLYMSQFAYGGIVARLGFACLAVLWLVTGLLAYRAIRRGDIDTHRLWMIRNFALAFAAVMLRIYIPLGVAMGLDFAAIYPIIAWLCWIPNLIFVELRFNRVVRRSPAVQ